jgi:hypothetical protein
MLSLIISSDILSVIIKKTPIRNTTWQLHPGVIVSTPWHLRCLAFESSIWSPRFSRVSLVLEQMLVYHLKTGPRIISLTTFYSQLPCLCYITYVCAANKVTLRTQMKHRMISRCCWLNLSSLRQQLLVFAANLTWQGPSTSKSPWQFTRSVDAKGRFTHSMPRPCRPPAMPCC